MCIRDRCWDSPQIQYNGTIVTDADGTRHVGQPITMEVSPAPYGGPPKRVGPRPLDGVRVVDFGAFVAGPFASLVMADLGAEVIKVETPAGDPNRSIFRSWSPVSRGKRAISVDLKHPEGLALAKKICMKSDIITSNFRTGVSARLGIDPASLHAAKPELIVLESPAYGSSGPLAERAGFDLVMQALCGHEYRAGGKGNEPLWNRTSMVDYGGGLLGAIGALAALYHRARTGEGMTLYLSLIHIFGDMINGINEILAFFAVSILIATCALYWYTRCVRSTLLVVTASLVAVTWQMGLLPLLGFDLNPYSVLVPFLVFAIGMSHGAQKMNGVMQDIGRGTHPLIAARYTFRRLFLAGFAALTCDAASFAVLMTIKIEAIRELALIASLGVGILIFTNLIMLPMLLSYTGVSRKAAVRSLSLIHISIGSRVN